MRLSSAPLLCCLLLVLATAGTGCVYRMDIQQGNFLKEEDVAKVQPGMTRSQVRFLLGTPMVADSFQNDRWDYVHYTETGRMRHKSQRHVIVWFDGDHVQRMERPDGGPAATAAAQPKKRNWLKFWKREKNAPEPPPRKMPELPPAS
ncbi:MAG: outer membrane protein assembly factor BamE [Steroidobacteraceae bacterium]